MYIYSILKADLATIHCRSLCSQITRNEWETVSDDSVRAGNWTNHSKWFTNQFRLFPFSRFTRYNTWLWDIALLHHLLKTPIFTPERPINDHKWCCAKGAPACRSVKGARRLRPVTKSMVPSWDLVLVLEAMCEPPFEPLESLDLRMLSYKMLLALASAKCVGDLPVLSVHPTCIQFVLDGSRVVLRPNAAYTPKVLSGAHSALSFVLPALSNLSIDSEEDRKLHALCPEWAILRYVEQTQATRSSD